MFEDPIANPLLLDGTATAVVEDPAGITPPHTIIQSNDAWRVRVNWTMSGLIAGFLGGDFHVRVYAESVGGGFEGQLGATVNIAVASVPNPPPKNYQALVNVAAGFLAPGAYKLVTLINYSNLGVPQEMAAFVEGPIIQIYQV
jgi:hypothetical protein